MKYDAFKWYAYTLVPNLEEVFSERKKSINFASPILRYRSDGSVPFDRNPSAFLDWKEDQLFLRDLTKPFKIWEDVKLFEELRLQDVFERKEIDHFFYNEDGSFRNFNARWAVRNYNKAKTYDKLEQYFKVELKNCKYLNGIPPHNLPFIRWVEEEKRFDYAYILWHNIIGIKYYKPDAPKAESIQHLTATKQKTNKWCEHGTLGGVLYNFNQLILDEDSAEPLFICEGEKDCLTLLLRNIPATCLSTGCSSLAKFGINVLKNREIYIVYDNDEAGREGSQKLYNQIMGYFDNNVKIHNICLKKLSPQLQEKEDIYDLFCKYDYNAKEFVDNIRNKVVELEYDKPPTTSKDKSPVWKSDWLRDINNGDWNSTHPREIGDISKLTNLYLYKSIVYINGVEKDTYNLVTEYTLFLKKQDEPNQEVTINLLDNPELFSFLAEYLDNKNKDKSKTKSKPICYNVFTRWWQGTILHKAFPRLNELVNELGYSIFDMQENSECQQRFMKCSLQSKESLDQNKNTDYYCGFFLIALNDNKIEQDKYYEIGYFISRENGSKNNYIYIPAYRQLQNGIVYKINEGDTWRYLQKWNKIIEPYGDDLLRFYRENEYAYLTSGKIKGDVEDFTTRTSWLHTLIVSLTFHSCIRFLKGAITKRGTLATFIISETGIGKSTCFNHLKFIYQEGISINYSTATALSLTGGMDQKSKMVVSGVLQKRNESVVCLEEVQANCGDLLVKVRNALSSNVFDISRVGFEGSFPFYIMLILHTNLLPTEPRFINKESRGLDIAAQIIGSSQDVRRFDFIYVKTKAPEMKQYRFSDISKVDLSIFNLDFLLFKVHKMRKLEPKNIIFEQPQEIAKTLLELKEKYKKYAGNVITEDSFDEKIKRVAIAVAGEFFSWNIKNPTRLLVKPVHFKIACEIWDELYIKNEDFGLGNLIVKDEIRNKLKQIILKEKAKQLDIKDAPEHYIVYRILKFIYEKKSGLIFTEWKEFIANILRIDLLKNNLNFERFVVKISSFKDYLFKTHALYYKDINNGTMALHENIIQDVNTFIEEWEQIHMEGDNLI